MGQAEGLMDWSAYPNFTRSEFVCRCGCGRADMQPGFMSALQMLRDAYARPMPVSSGYRCPNHPKEAAKATPGAHASGCAADVAVHGGLRRMSYSDWLSTSDSPVSACSSVVIIVSSISIH
jgi:hypothetical protein